MREITDHIIEGSKHNEPVVALDKPGIGNASHTYLLKVGMGARLIAFQNGAIDEVGDVNGISNEQLLAVLIDRIRGFQSGPYACESNQVALVHLEGAMKAFHDRTKDRSVRGVEGKHQV